MIEIERERERRERRKKRVPSEMRMRQRKRGKDKIEICIEKYRKRDNCQTDEHIKNCSIEKRMDRGYAFRE